ncbi:MAG: alpha/beta hydrolase [Sulfitobacter sp.]
MIPFILKFAVASLLVTGTIALGLIFTQYPKELPPGEGLDFTKTLAGAAEEPQPQTAIKMRDGYAAQVRLYPSSKAGAPLLVLIHGSGWHGMQFDALARTLSAGADVVIPDLRGHGFKPGVRGDISYINQYEDDLADLITSQQKPGQKVVLLGHSSGGGLIVRFAGGTHGAMMDAAVLLAPYLKYNAPTTRANSGGWSQPLTRRIIGLSMLNTFGITALNHLPILQLRMPQAVLDGPLGDTATTEYSYRLNTGFAPRSDYLKDVAALPRFVLIAGADDEAFDAAQYAPTLSEVTDKGSYIIVDGVRHLDIVDAPETARAIESLIHDL